ncbi:MAG: DUF1559 domain-containing protein [Planctomycetaceae bacterium]|jgi:hypothetical protein|nr:DUF1559 domain-containing protein [Planctomycetaceae bacterium]
MRVFFLTLLFIFSLLFSGCSDKSNSVKPDSVSDGELSGGVQNGDNPDKPSDTTGSSLPSTISVSLPSVEMLAALGDKQNDLDTRWFFSDAYYVLTGQPKRFFESEVGKGSEEILSSVFNAMFQMEFPIDYSKVERFTFVAAPQGLITFDETTPDGAKNKRQSLALRRITIFNLNEPNADAVLKTIWKSQSNLPLESIKRRIGNAEYYNLLHPNIPTDQISAGIHLPDDRTIIIFIMLADDANKLFTSKAASNSAAVERIKRLDINSNLLALSASLEGLTAEPERIAEIPFVGSVLANLGIENAKSFIANFRSINLTVKPDAQIGKPMLTARYDAIDNNGAKKIYELFLGLHVTAQTTFASIKDETAMNLPLPKETIINLLKSIELEKTTDTGFHFRINKYDGFDTALKTGFADTGVKLREEKIRQRQLEQLKALANVLIQYDRLNKKFPQPICDADGKPLLSWRVAILPLIGQQELYNKFNLKEKWDSPTNLQLIKSIPPIFTPPNNTEPNGKTQIQRFTSTETPLSDPNMTIAKIKQPRTTLMLFQTTESNAIEWTKPDELTYDENNIDKIFNNTIIAITFSGEPIRFNLLPQNNPQHKQQKNIISKLIKDQNPQD